jgi:antitoxin PrlF
MHYNQVRKDAIGKEMATSTLTSKGQITIPKEIREHLKIHPGNRLEFRIASDGRVVMQSRSRDVRELKGIVRSSRRKPVSIEEMNKAIAHGFGGR